LHGMPSSLTSKMESTMSKMVNQRSSVFTKGKREMYWGWYIRNARLSHNWNFKWLHLIFFPLTWTLTIKSMRAPSKSGCFSNSGAKCRTYCDGWGLHTCSKCVIENIHLQRSMDGWSKIQTHWWIKAKSNLKLTNWNRTEPI
jgi:hypothetical protein